ncbi:MAG: hypothetical protein IPP74_00990 [Alphaproteobacteria bacterium]|nr:hypothetical protein [Alphaproteobacteria bacterium]
MFALKHLNIVSFILISLASLAGCKTPDFIGRSELANRASNPILFNYKASNAEEVRLSQTGDTNKTDNSYLLFTSKPMAKIKNKIYGALRFKNDTPNPNDDRFVYLRKRDSNIMAETILLDNHDQKTYLGMGEVGNKINAFGAQIRFEY